jgi:hypothetical protein
MRVDPVIRSGRKPGYADAVPPKYPPFLAVETEAGTVIGPTSCSATAMT